MGKRFQTVAAMACMKSLLMIFNLAFWASGLAIICAGIYMKTDLHRYFRMSADYSNAVPYILVGTGALVLFVGTLACGCTVKGQPSLLYLYGGFLVVILILELALAASIYAYKDRLSDGFDRGLNRSMENYNQNSLESTTDLDFVQSTLHCCGNHDYKDWNKLNPPQPVPRVCCIYPSACDVQDDSDVYQLGCYSELIRFLDSNMAIIGGIALGLTFFPLLGTILSCCLAANIAKAKYEQMA